MGRPLNGIEIAAFCGIVLLGGLLAPAPHRILVEAALLVPLSVYNVYVARGRVSLILVAVAIGLVVLAALFPPGMPTGPAPD